jgi:hypothetical protein
MMKGTVVRLIGRIWILAVLALSCFGVAGCSMVKSITTSDKEAKQLFKSRDQYVRIVKQDSGKGQAVAKNDQPVELDSELIRAALNTLEIMLPGMEKSQPVFTDTQLDMLAKYLSQGLTQAGPNEDVIFAIIDNFKAVYGLTKEQKFTSGRAFYQDGKLNIIFGKIQEDYKSYGMYAPVDRRLYPLSPGVRSVASQHTWKLLEHPDMQFQMIANGLRSDWIKLDLAAMTARAAMGEQAARSGNAVGEGGVISVHKTVEERLKTLNELKDKKLITDEEYQKKRAAILGDL